MKRFFLGALMGAVLLAPALRAGPEYPDKGPDLYDTHADADQQINAALKVAVAEHKRVLVDFGANWCIWCRRLHSTFVKNTDVAKALDRSFIVVLVDVNGRNGIRRNAPANERYGNPIQHGLPVLVVLGADGRLLTTKDTGGLEEGDGHSPQKILEFLAAWAPR